jgi:hypothetical protein
MTVRSVKRIVALISLGIAVSHSPKPILLGCSGQNGTCLNVESDLRDAEGKSITSGTARSLIMMIKWLVE